MKTAVMSDKQRRALEAMEAARGEGCSLTQYAKANGLVVRELYAALAALRRKGVLAKAVERSKSAFVPVRVAPASSSAAARPLEAPGLVCRIVYAAGFSIECTQWPQAHWIAALSASAGAWDAAS